MDKGHQEKTISQATKEIQARVERRDNNEIFNVPEHDSNLRNEILAADTECIIKGPKGPKAHLNTN